MTNTNFEQVLQHLELTKKDFAQIVGMPYQTLMNWKQKDETPIWVDSWIENYKKARKYEIIKALILEQMPPKP